MCKRHWRHYAASLARDAKAGKAAPAAGQPAIIESEHAAEQSKRSRRRGVALVAAEPEVDAG